MIEHGPQHSHRERIEQISKIVSVTQHDRKIFQLRGASYMALGLAYTGLPAYAVLQENYPAAIDIYCGTPFIISLAAYLSIPEFKKAAYLHDLETVIRTVGFVIKTPLSFIPQPEMDYLKTQSIQIARNRDALIQHATQTITAPAHKRLMLWEKDLQFAHMTKIDMKQLPLEVQYAEEEYSDVQNRNNRKQFLQSEAQKIITASQKLIQKIPADHELQTSIKKLNLIAHGMFNPLTTTIFDIRNASYSLLYYETWFPMFDLGRWNK